jgi:Xaa-Pro aminopeptidase
MNEELAELFFSNTRVDKNLKYLLGCDVADDIAAVLNGGKLSILAPALEINRLGKESKANEIIPIESLGAGKSLRLEDAIVAFIEGVAACRDVAVRENFPFKLASNLLANGFRLSITDGRILATRLVKSDGEIECIKKSLGVVKACIDHVRELLRQANVTNGGTLKLRGRELTSEFLRAVIENFCYANGCLAEDTILSCWHQSADPHCRGYGPIYANQFIVMDLFPFDRDSGYYADVTRTFIRGEPNEAQRKMHGAVKSAQEMAQKKLKPGVSCADLLAGVLEFFRNCGYETDRRAQVPHGMFHSLGHGFGLEIHEDPVLAGGEKILGKGNAVTLEPGLYYTEIGGVRIEDDFLLTDSGAIKLSAAIADDWIIT